MKVSEKVSQTPHRPAPPLSPRPPIFLAVATSAAETAANNARSAAAGSRSVTIRSRLRTVRDRSVTIRSRLQTVRDRSVAIRSRLRTVRDRSVAVRSRSRTVRNRAETTAFRVFFAKNRVLTPKPPFPPPATAPVSHFWDPDRRRTETDRFGALPLFSAGQNAGRRAGAAKRVLDRNLKTKHTQSHENG
jgi:hypothetical protein